MYVCARGARVGSTVANGYLILFVNYHSISQRETNQKALSTLEPTDVEVTKSRQFISYSKASLDKR